MKNFLCFRNFIQYFVGQKYYIKTKNSIIVLLIVYVHINIFADRKIPIEIKKEKIKKPAAPQSPPLERKNEEKPDFCPFKSPSIKQINVIRKTIEDGNIVEFEKMVESNPLYLVTQNDSPLIYKPGCK